MRISRAVLLLTAAVVVSGCGATDPAPTSAPAVPAVSAARSATPFSSEPLSSTTSPVPSSTVRSAEVPASECARPRDPVALTELAPSATLPEPGSSRHSLDFAETRGELDSDGDGTPDEIVETDPGAESTADLIIRRFDGELRLRAAGRHASFLGPPIGDLDGDGRDEITVLTSSTDPEDLERTSFVVPGSLAAGVHRIQEVGIQVPPLEPARPLPVGDQDGDGTDDLAAPTGTDPVTAIHSGADIMAGGAGTRLRSWPEPVDVLDGFVHGRLLVDGQRPVLVTIEPDPFGQAALPPSVELVLHTDPMIRLRAPLDDDLGAGAWPRIGAYREDGDRFVRMERSSRDGTTVAIWNLDTPCPTPVVGSTTLADQR